MMDAAEIKKFYIAHKSEIQKKIKRLILKKPRNLDEVFEEAHEEVFNHLDCLDCANCCKTTSPMLFEKDIERLSQHLRMKSGDFVSKFLFLDSDGIYAMKQTPCPFLGSDNHCSVYEYRPKACREFPHSNSRKMHTLLKLAEKNAEICPAVSRILLQIEI